MSKIAVLTAISGALVAGSLALAGPAAAHRGDAGDGSATPAGAPATSSHTTDPQIGVGIFTAPATSTGPGSITSRAAVGGGEQPYGPVGAAPAA